MSESIFDCRGRGLSTISPDEIPNEIESISLANNEFEMIPDEVFLNKTKLWNVDVSNNKLISLQFTKCFKSLHTLDVRNNQLEIDELLDIRHLYVQDLRLAGNGFQKHIAAHPLVLVSLLKRAWIIDGMFITDFIRKSAKDFKKTVTFGEVILAARREQLSEVQSLGVTQIATAFLSGTSCKFESPGLYNISAGITLQSLTKRPQIDRLKHLASQYHFNIPSSEFIDLFGLALGILTHQWLNLPINIIPRLLSRGFWGTISADIEKLEDYELWIYLLQLKDLVKPRFPFEQEIWNAIKLENYLQTGVVPVTGSTPRMILSALIYRGIDPEEIPHNTDIKLYSRFRQSCGFTSLDEELSSIHAEIIGSLPIPNKIPEKGETIAVTHPLTNEWVNLTATVVRNGRIYCKVNDMIIQYPISSLFWDGRGVWREAKRRKEGRSRSTMLTRSTFLTAGETAKTETQEPHFEEEGENRNFELPRAKSRVCPVSPTFFLDTAKTMMRTSPFSKGALTQTVSRSSNTEHFKHIPDPRLPQRRTIPRNAPTRKANQVVEGVVNIAFGPEISYGRRLRRFHTRVVNTITNKSQYVWINEDEVSEEDVAMLVELYKQQIESKMHVVKERHQSPMISNETFNTVEFDNSVVDSRDTRPVYKFT